MYENRIAHLKEAHAFLNKQIDGLEKTGNFTDDAMSELKKRRLFLKDEIAKLERKQWEHDHDSLDHWEEEDH